jgi:glycosyltransferase involved in cell wall biosynthesis
MTITVILCTYNRSGVLAKALDSLACSRVAEATEWEVLVVDNNSRDQTRAVVKEFCRREPGHFRYLFEPEPGKSYALNRGIREARGEILAFLDDDITVEPDWLQNLASAFNHAEWSGVGGRTVPDRNFSPPGWLPFREPYFFGGILCALFDFGDQPGELHQAPYGANMAFRKTMFEKYGGFRTDLGPSPNREIPRPNEDTEFGRRLMAAGERLWYEPTAIVYHPILEERLNKEYFLSWWFDFGRALIRERGPRPSFYGIPRYYLSIPRMLSTHLPIRVLQWLCTWNPSDRFFKKCWVRMTLGQIVEIYRTSHGLNGQERGARQ